MSQGNCSIHGLVNAEWKEGGTNKAGKAYAGFWKCPQNSRQPDGKYLNCRITMPNNPTGQFDQSLDKSASITDGQKKDTTITRLAIAKSLIENGWRLTIENDKTGLGTRKEFQMWIDVVEGRATPITQTGASTAVPAAVSSDEIPF